MKLERVKRFYRVCVQAVARAIKIDQSKIKKRLTFSGVERERLGIALTMGFAVFAFWAMLAVFFSLPFYNCFIAAFFGVAVCGFFYLGTKGIDYDFED